MQKAQLKTAPLGNTGLEISRVGFGAWAIGGGGWEFGWGPQKDEAIVGFRRPDQVDSILAAAGLELTDAEARQIEETQGRRAA